MDRTLDFEIYNIFPVACTSVHKMMDFLLQETDEAISLAQLLTSFDQITMLQAQESLAKAQQLRVRCEFCFLWARCRFCA